MKNILFITMLLGFGYSECNESNWEEYYPNMGWCDLFGANLSWANLEGADLYEAHLEGANLQWANLEGACLEGAINCTQTNYNGTPILEGCASGGGDCSFEDTDEDGYDDVSYEVGYENGATSGDLNLDGTDDVLDVVILINNILAYE